METSCLLQGIVHSLIKMALLVFLNTSKEGKHREGVCGDIRAPRGWEVGGGRASLITGGHIRKPSTAEISETSRRITSRRIPLFSFGFPVHFLF